MSTSTAATIARRPSWLAAHPAAKPVEAPEERRSHLEVVPTRAQRRARPRALYAVVAVASLLTIVVAQLLLSIGISQGAYQLDTLQQKQTTLQRSVQAASEDLTRISSPQNLAANANALGMVSNSNPAYLRLSDGAVLGAPIAADGAAGTVTGGQGNLVPNSLLAGVPLAGQQGTGSAQQNSAQANGQEANSTGPGAATGTPAAPTVPLEGALPTPVTH
ncbi:hypothetical protein P5G50_14350 [Leifsonia sp. F6_8S_P_1B]|uniref:Cell division protein FtsL n=1 Tax=Leifsonia williamsii TaxID=3035919 RepID=A0ABT8KF31_9MICO|nr:hypothetical protein [Leifsonia williamsii]MDN4615628.1 hypothetical protein [Leifsonia williamsii]